MCVAAASDPLPAWQAGATKDSIVAFVAELTDKGFPDYVLPAERVASFDNDGTLWSEKPVYFQLLFAIDRIKALHAANWRGWTVVDMKQDCIQNYPTDK